MNSRTEELEKAIGFGRFDEVLKMITEPRNLHESESDVATILGRVKECQPELVEAVLESFLDLDFDFAHQPDYLNLFVNAALY